MKKREIVTAIAVLTSTLFITGCTININPPVQQNTGNGTVQQTTDGQAATTQTTTVDTQTGTGESVASPAQPATGAPAAGITEEKAKEIALADAGLNASDVTFTKLGREFDDGMDKYDVDFISGTMEYDYDIDANTGAILSKSQEVDDDRVMMQTQTQTQTQTTTQTPAATQGTGTAVSQEQALNIAMQAANVDSKSVTGSRVKLEFEDDYGKQIYDVKFYVGMTEYDYDIDPESGAVLSYDIDMDD